MRDPKKMVTIGVRVPEELKLRLEAIADSEGIDLSVLARIAFSDLVDKRRNQWLSLNSIFGHEEEEEQDEFVQPCSTGKSAT